MQDQFRTPSEGLRGPAATGGDGPPSRVEQRQHGAPEGIGLQFNTRHNFMQGAELTEGELLGQQSEGIRCAQMEFAQPVYGDPNDLLLFGVEMSDRMHGNHRAPGALADVLDLDSHLGGSEDIEMSDRNYPATIVAVRLVENMQLHGTAVDQSCLFAQAPGHRLGEAFLGAEDRPGQLPLAVTGMSDEHMETMPRDR